MLFSTLFALGFLLIPYPRAILMSLLSIPTLVLPSLNKLVLPALSGTYGSPYFIYLLLILFYHLRFILRPALPHLASLPPPSLPSSPFTCIRAIAAARRASGD